MEEFLECSVCMNPFDNSNLRTPKMLPCQHSFCFECLERMYEVSRVTCPTCRIVHSIPRIENLPNSFILLQLIDIQSHPSELSDATNCQKCCKSSKNMSTHCQGCLDALIGNEVARVVELMQGAERGGSERAKLRKRKTIVISKHQPPPVCQLPSTDSDLFSYMRTITILMVLFSIAMVIGFKSSPYFSGIRLNLHEFFSSIFYQFSTILKSVLKVSRKILPDVISAMKNLFAIVFQNFMTCLSLIGRFVGDVAPFIFAAFSQVLIFLLECFATSLKVLLQLCLTLLSASGSVLTSLLG